MVLPKEESSPIDCPAWKIETMGKMAWRTSTGQTSAAMPSVGTCWPPMNAILAGRGGVGGVG